MKTARRFRTMLLAGTTLLGTTVACTPRAADEALSERDQGPAPDIASGDERTASSTSGVEVSISLDPLPLRPGLLQLEIALTDVPPEALPLSLDLVSPEMPMHGIVRYEAEASGAALYRAVVDIPMEGLWELYVNLDYGADAAVFELEVPVGPGSSGHDHHVVREVEDVGATEHAEHRGEGEGPKADADHRHGPSPEGHSGTTPSEKDTDPGSHAGHGPR